MLHSRPRYHRRTGQAAVTDCEDYCRAHSRCDGFEYHDDIKDGSGTYTCWFFDDTLMRNNSFWIEGDLWLQPTCAFAPYHSPAPLVCRHDADCSLRLHLCRQPRQRGSRQPGRRPQRGRRRRAGPRPPDRLGENFSRMHERSNARTSAPQAFGRDHCAGTRASRTSGPHGHCRRGSFTGHPPRGSRPLLSRVLAV